MVLSRRGDLLSSDWSTGFNVELVLDRLKQKEATKRVLFLHSRTFQYSKKMVVDNGKKKSCEEQDVFLRVSRRTEDAGTPSLSRTLKVSLCTQDDRDFRDKITPISVAMEYQLDYQQAADPTGLKPVLDTAAPSNVTKQVSVQVSMATAPEVC